MLATLVAESNKKHLNAILSAIATVDDKFVVDIAVSPAQALARISDGALTYDVLVVGHGLGKSGADLCRHARTAYPKLSIIKVLEHYTEEAHQQALGFGANDVVSADRLPHSLENKLGNIYRFFANIADLHEQLGYAQKTAFAAMSSMGELAIVLEFLRQSTTCSEPGVLANLILDAVEKYDLTGVVRVSVKDDVHVYSRSGVDQRAESNLMHNTLTMGRLFEFGGRGAYNFGKVSLVVVGMPVGDPDRCGRLRDNLALLAEAAETKAIAIELAKLSSQREQAITAAQKGLFLNLKAGRAQQKVTNQNATAAIAKFKSEIEADLMHFALSASQEEDIMQTVSAYTQRLAEYLKSNEAVIDNVEQIADLFSEMDRAFGAPS